MANNLFLLCFAVCVSLTWYFLGYQSWFFLFFHIFRVLKCILLKSALLKLVVFWVLCEVGRIFLRRVLDSEKCFFLGVFWLILKTFCWEIADSTSQSSKTVDSVSGLFFFLSRVEVREITTVSKLFSFWTPHTPGGETHKQSQLRCLFSSYRISGCLIPDCDGDVKGSLVVRLEDMFLYLVTVFLSFRMSYIN